MILCVNVEACEGCRWYLEQDIVHLYTQEMKLPRVKSIRTERKHAEGGVN